MAFRRAPTTVPKRATPVLRCAASQLVPTRRGAVFAVIPRDRSPRAPTPRGRRATPRGACLPLVFGSTGRQCSHSGAGDEHLVLVPYRVCQRWPPRTRLTKVLRPFIHLNPGYCRAPYQSRIGRLGSWQRRQCLRPVCRRQLVQSRAGGVAGMVCAVTRSSSAPAL